MSIRSVGIVYSMSWVDPAEELQAIHRWFTERNLELELFETSSGR